MPFYERVVGTHIHQSSVPKCHQCGDVYMCIKCQRDVFSGSIFSRFTTNAEDEYVDRKTMQPKNFLHSVLQRLKEDNFCVVKNLVPLETARKMYSEVEKLHELPDNFKPGKLGKGAMNRVGSLEEVRGDSVMWVDGSKEETPFTSEVAKQMNKLALSIYHIHNISMNRISKSKIMASCYDGKGASYKRHIDSITDGSLKLTFIFYLNEKFTSQDGGCLRVHKESGSIDVVPELGKLVIFRSDKLIHEVLPTFARRFAVTIWYMEVLKRKAVVEDMQQETTKGPNSDEKAPKICVQPKRMKLEQ